MVYLVAAGSNGAGQLGIDSIDDCNTFQQCAILDSFGRMKGHGCTVLRIATGASHTLMLTRHNGVETDTTLWYSGTNDRGQLGLNTPTSYEFQPFPLDSALIPISFFPNVISKTAVHTYLENCRKLKDLVGKKYYIADVAASWETSFLLLRPRNRNHHNHNYSYNYNNSHDNVVVDDDDIYPDLLLSCGSNDWGQLGRIAELDDEIEGCGTESFTKKLGYVDFTPSLSSTLHHPHQLRIHQIAAGPQHVLAYISWTGKFGHKVEKAQLFGWGARRQGQLGLFHGPGLTSQKIMNVPCPIILPLDEFPNITTTMNDPNLIQIVTGRDHTTLAVTACRDDDSSASCDIISFGSSRKSQLCFGQTMIPLQVPGTKISKLGTRLAHPIESLHRNKNDNNNSSSSSNTRCTINSSLPPITLYSSWNSSFAVPKKKNDNGTLFWSWGSNLHGQLGHENHNAENLDKPRQISLDNHHGDGDGGGNCHIQSFAAGSEHALTTIQEEKENEKITGVYVWGWNEHGNLGLGHNNDVNEPTLLHPSCLNKNDYIVSVFAGNGSSWLVIDNV